MAVIFALSATVLIGLVGGGIDYARLSARRSLIQNALDVGVLAGGNTLKLASATPASVSGVTEQAIREAVISPPDRPLTVQVTVPTDKSSVLASASEDFKLAFGPFIGVRSAHIELQSKANVVGKMRLCMLTLDPTAPGAFNLQKNAQVTATGCSLYSNSTNASSMVGGDASIAKAETICSAGGYTGPRANFAPPPQTSCPAIKDPLKGRTPPTIGPCAQLPIPFASTNPAHTSGQNIINKSVIFSPGTYCGGLRITSNAIATLMPGIYIIKDGPLIVDGTATLSGTGVAFYFIGDAAGLAFDKNTTISLEAPTTGQMAGFLMSEDPVVTNPLFQL